MIDMATDIADLVGHTPLVRINRLFESNDKVSLYAKLERYNPGGSVKDRIAKYMIEYAEKDGTLTKDKIVLEPTSGNTGIGLAMICAVKGYRCTLVMPETMSIERRKILHAYGAKIVLSPGAKGMDGAEDLVKEMAKDPQYFVPGQFSNKYNVLAHYETTGKEVWEATGGRITHFVAGLGTTGTIMGVSKYLRERKPEVKICAVSPNPKSKIQGLKNMETQYVPSIYDPAAHDEKIFVADEDAFDTARLLAVQEGIFCGISSGAAMYGAIQVAKGLSEGIVVVVIPDGGEKYISTPLYDPKKCFECLKKAEVPTCFTEEYIASLECEEVY
jgi:cysteine synthase